MIPNSGRFSRLPVALLSFNRQLDLVNSVGCGGVDWTRFDRPSSCRWHCVQRGKSGQGHGSWYQAQPAVSFLSSIFSSPNSRHRASQDFDCAIFGEAHNSLARGFLWRYGKRANGGSYEPRHLITPCKHLQSRTRLGSSGAFSCRPSRSQPARSYPLSTPLTAGSQSPLGTIARPRQNLRTAMHLSHWCTEPSGQWPP